MYAPSSWYIVMYLDFMNFLNVPLIVSALVSSWSTLSTYKPVIDLDVMSNQFSNL